MLTKGQRSYNHIAFDWIVLSEPTSAEETKLFNDYALPSSFFELKDETTLASMQLCTTRLDEEGFILHLPLWSENNFSKLKAASRSLTSFVTSNMILIWIDKESHADAVEGMEKSVSAFDFIYKAIMNEYTNLSSVLDDLQARIVEVENQTKAKANRDVLLQLTNLEQEVVIVSRRLDDYEESMGYFLSHSLVERYLSITSREQIRLAVKKSHYRIHLYKDLVESTSGLLSDSIDNKLNTIMEYLQTLALVISVPTLVFSLFGINTSGIIGRETPFGSWVVIGAALLLGLGTAWWLKKKEFR